MKIVNARTGQLQTIPFNLGEAGRGRHLEEVRLDQRNPPTGPENVGYVTFGGDPAKGYMPHCVLTAPRRDQTGILLHISAAGTYTRGSDGTVALKGGEAKLLTRGNFAEGDAGRCEHTTDELWHVQSPSVFVVNVAGGSWKGEAYGHFYLIVTRRFEAVMIKRAALCQRIATDSDPDITEVVRQYANQLHADVRAAFEVADQLEEAAEAEVVPIIHFMEHGTAEEAAARWGLAVPVAMGGKVSGVSGVQARTLLPGDKALVSLSIGPGGGRRYSYEVISEAGLSRLAEENNSKYTAKSVLALAEAPDWQIAWSETKDSEVSGWVIANAKGIHRMPGGGQEHPRPLVGDQVSSQRWNGHQAEPMTYAEFAKVFGWEQGNGSQEPEPDESPIATALKRAGW